MGYGEMEEWVTCREPLGLEICRRAQVESLGAERPQGRAIGKIHIVKEVKYVYKSKVSFENQHSNIPSFHV
jgi:hypothetical protein